MADPGTQTPSPPREVVMPRLSETMEEGTILKWLKADGEPVRQGEDLAEIETDKATLTFAADAAGVLEIVAAAGETHPTGTLIARIGPDGEGGGEVAAAARPGPTRTTKGEITVVEPTRAQQAIARRTAEAKATVPELTVHGEIDMEAAVALRDQLRALGAADAIAAPTFNDLIVKACALALREAPRVNAGYRDARFERHGRVNVGVVVATSDAFVTPTILDADRKPLAQIAAEARALAERARAGALTAPELAGATFTVSNLGMHGVSAFTPVITPPQAAVLGAGRIERRAVVRDGELAARHTMTVTLVCDHRILHGTDAAAFLGRVRALLELPLALTR